VEERVGEGAEAAAKGSTSKRDEEAAAAAEVG
jgi:hypothetical protein